MVEAKNKAWVKWLLIILGVVALAIVAFFVVKPMIENAEYGTKEYNVEESADGIAVKVTTLERLPMADPKCQERTFVPGSDESKDCVIANVTITNNSDTDYDYSYRNFGKRDPKRGDDVYRMALTRVTTFEGVDVTKTLAPGESHSQEAHLDLDKKDKLSDIQLVYRVTGDTEISIQL